MALNYVWELHTSLIFLGDNLNVLRQHHSVVWSLRQVENYKNSTLFQSDYALTILRSCL